tara:strand:+ start:925 stop:4368 length:3444 start_codon:yes stop_codon:yes gene_type:complete
LPAGDGNDQNEQAVSPGQLSERRERFHLNLTDEDDNNRGLVGSGQEFYEFQRPQVESNQKFNSINVLSGQRTPSFNVRQVVAQRQLSKLDPINKYYIMGGDRDIRNKITYTPLESNDAYGNESLTPESPNSINVNFNVAGYRRSGPRTVVLGLSREDKTDIENARRGQLRTYGPPIAGVERYKGYIFPAGYPKGAAFAGSNRPFNFINEINNLAAAGLPEIFETMEDVRRFYPIVAGRGPALENGSLTKTIGGPPRIIRTNRGRERLWDLSDRMRRILRVLDYDDFDEFTDDHPMFIPERNGNPYYSNAHIPDNQRNSPYDGYNNSLRAVMERINSEYGLEKVIEAANATLTRTERITMAREQEPVVYEFYDFETRTSYVRDPYTEVLNEVPGTRLHPGGRIRLGDNEEDSITVPKPAKITGIFNYSLPGYSDEVANRAIPESALPNLYVYQLAVGSDPIGGLSGQGWDSSPQGDEVRRGYDGLVTLNEFITGTLPRLRSQQQAGEDRGISDYLIQYGRATRDTNVVVDLTSSIARRYYNQTTDATSMNLFAEFNEYKHEFPLYAEISIPMVEQGSLNQLLNESLGATSMVNSIIDAPADDPQPFIFTTYGAIAPRGVSQLGPDQLDSRERNIAIVENRAQTKVYDFNTWLTNTRAALSLNDLAELSLNGPWRERNGGQAALSAWTNQVRSQVRTQSQERLVKYKDLLEGEKTLCDSETIMYKLVKYASRGAAHDRATRRVIQNYYFANTNEIDVINFVDTQVKSDKYYQYELYAYDVVYGSKFSFRTRFATFPGYRDTLLTRRSVSDDDGGTLAFYSFNVNSEPNLKIVEYPLVIGEWRNVGQAGRLGQIAVPTVRGRPDFTVGGVSYPVIKIMQYPPLTPEVSIFSYQNTSNKILINLSPSVGEYIGPNALRPKPFDAEEAEVFTDLSFNQRLNDPAQFGGTVSFKESAKPPEMVIYRTEEIDTNVAHINHLYRSFAGKEIKRMNLSLGAPAENFAKGFDFIDDIEPNRKYYYTFRAVTEDIPGKVLFSNPTAIYEVELRLIEGFYTPIVKEYVPQITTSKTPTKKMKRYIEIKGADIQVEPFNEASQASGFTNSRTGLFSSEKSLIPQTGQNGITGNKFIVRLTSRETGKKVDLVLNFTSTEKR